MVGRFKKLEQELLQGLKRLPKSKPSYRREREYTMRAIVKDLQKINMLVPRLLGLVEKPERLGRLVAYWKKRGNSVKTVRLKLAILAQIYKVNYSVVNFPSFPSYIELNLPTPKEVSFCINGDYPIEQIADEELKQKCKLQQLFGLKKMEALKFSVNMVVGDQIQLPRVMTYNNRDRKIPIVTDEQKEFLEKLSILDRSYKNCCSRQIKGLSQIYQYYFQRYGINDHDYYRYCYIKERYQMLRQGGNRALVAQQLLAAEVGYKQTRRIRGILKCLNVS